MIFSALYDLMLRWAAHRHAPWYLGSLSFAESSFFPIPPDVMLAPMTLARPERAWRYAMLTTATSVLGGLAGYFIGAFGIEWIEPKLHQFGYHEAYLHGREWFTEWGALAVLLAGFSPIPYKVFTIAAGALSLSLPVFALMSVIGRGARFFLVAGLIRWGGPSMEAGLRRHADTLGWVLVLGAVIGYFLLRR